MALPKLLIILFLTTLMAAQTAPCPEGVADCATGIPRLVKFSGTLKDLQARPQGSVVGILFSVYADAVGGAPLWQEMQNVKLDQEGRFTVLLGSGTQGGMPVNLFSTPESRWLALQPALPNEEERPRVLLVSVPYALKAADADTLGGMPASAFLRAVPDYPGQPIQGPGSQTRSTRSGGVTALPNDIPVTTTAGTPDTLAKFAAGSSIVDSQLTDSNGVASVQNLANILFADRYPNGVPDAIAACPANGCTIYAGATTVNRNLGIIDPQSKAITLYLGPFVYNVNQVILRKGLKIIGMGASGGNDGTVTCSSAKPCNGTTLQSVNGNAPVFVLPQANNQPATNVVISGFRLLGAPGNTSEDGILLDSSSLTNSGLWYSSFSDLYLEGFAGVAVHLKGPNNNFGAINQWVHFDKVIVFRMPNGGNGLRIEGANFEQEFSNCEFDGQTIGDGTNIYIGGLAGGIDGYPLNIRFTGLVTQAAAVGVQIDGAIGISFYSSHHEKLWGVYAITNNTNIGTKGVTVAETNFFGVGSNNGSGYLLNVGASTARGVIFAHNQILGNPDAIVIGTNLASIVYRDNLYYDHTSFNVPPGSGITTQMTPAAVLNIGGAHTIGLNPSATPITTIQSSLGPGETVTFFLLSGSAVFGSGGNINLMGQSNITVNGSITFVRSDLTGQSLAWVPVSQWNPRSTTAAADFKMSIVPEAASVHPGDGLNLNLSVIPSGGFAGVVAFHCAGTPPEATCTVSPNMASIAGGNVFPATVAIATAGSGANLVPYGPPNFYRLNSSFALLAVGMVFGFVSISPKRSTKRWSGFCFLIIFPLLALCTGCGGSSLPSGPGTPGGIYLVSVTGTSGTVSHSARLTLTVQ